MSTPQHFEQTAIGISNGASYIGIGTTVVSGLTLSEWGVVVGIVFWVLGFLGSQFWSYQRDKREKIESKQRIRYRRRAFAEMDRGKWATWQDGIDGAANDNHKGRSSNE